MTEQEIKSFEDGTLPVLMYDYHYEQQHLDGNRRSARERPCSVSLSAVDSFSTRNNIATEQNASPKLDRYEDQHEKSLKDGCGETHEHINMLMDITAGVLPLQDGL